MFVLLMSGVVAGFAGSPAHASALRTGAVSSESTDCGGRFARHLDAPARLDATFTIVNGLAPPPCYPFRTRNGLFPRHRDRRPRVDGNTGDAAFPVNAMVCAVAGTTAPVVPTR